LLITDTSKFVIIILSQSNEYHLKLTEELRKDIQDQAKTLKLVNLLKYHKNI